MVARSVSDPLRHSMSTVALAGRIYVAVVLHDAFRNRKAWQCAPKSCAEAKILSALAASSSLVGSSGGTTVLPLPDSVGSADYHPAPERLRVRFVRVRMVV